MIPHGEDFLSFFLVFDIVVKSQSIFFGASLTNLHELAQNV